MTLLSIYFAYWACCQSVTVFLLPFIAYPNTLAYGRVGVLRKKNRWTNILNRHTKMKVTYNFKILFPENIGTRIFFYIHLWNFVMMSDVENFCVMLANDKVIYTHTLTQNFSFYQLCTKLCDWLWVCQCQIIRYNLVV